MTRHSFLALAGITLLSTTILCGVAEAADKKSEPLALKTPAFIGGVGSDVVVRMRVEPDARSRELTLEWAANEDLSGGSHAVMLDGARAAATHQFSIKRLPAGEHVVTAILRFNDGTEVRKTSTVTIVGMGGVGTPINGGGQGAASARPADRR